MQTLSYMVARMQKMKADNLVGIGNHNQRKTDNHSNKDIDVERSHLNYDLVQGRTENYKTDIQEFIDENKAGTRATRKDAVLVNEWIISSDGAFFEDKDDKEIERFFEETKDYFADKFGDNNIRYAQVHLDETTPHMHLGVVPFDKENKLSAKRVFNRATLIEIQDELPALMQERGFDVQRGEKGSERKNLTVPEYKQAMETLNKVQGEHADLSSKYEQLKGEYDVLEEKLNRDTRNEKKLLEGQEKLFSDKLTFEPKEVSKANQDYQDVLRSRAGIEFDLKMEKSHNSRLTNDNDLLRRENRKLTKEVSKLKKFVNIIDNFLQKHFDISIPEITEKINENRQERRAEKERDTERDTPSR